MRALEWTPRAVRDLAAALDYLVDRHPIAASRLEDRLRAATSHLRAMPFGGRPGKFDTTREWIVPGTRYRFVYRVHRDRVEMLRVIHHRRGEVGSGD